MFNKVRFPFRFIVLLITLLVFMVSSASAAQLFEFKPTAAPSTDQFVKDEILVKFKSGVNNDEINRINRGLGIMTAHPTYNGAFRLKVPERKFEKLIQTYKKLPAVEYAEPNYIAHAFNTFEPNDPLYRPYQWNLDNDVNGGIQAEEAWYIQTGSDTVIVAVVDTGVAYENYKSGPRKYYRAPDLANTKFVPGYDFVENDTHPNDDNSHGTHVAGTIAQSTNNNTGVAGIAFNTAIMPVKVLNRNGSGTYDNIADGIRWAAENGAQVINLSLGGASPSQTLEDALAYAYNNGVTIVAASGNDGKGIVSYPAAYDNYVIAVGATRYDETRAYYSNYGSSLDLVAPGGDVNVDQNGDGYGDGVLQNTFNPNTKNTGDFGYWFFQGTSMAAPHVSGVAGLLIANGVTNPSDVRNILQVTAKDKGAQGRDDQYGYGVLNAYAALTYIPLTYNNPPAAEDDTTTTDEDTPVTINVLANDFDQDGDTLSVSLTQPQNGTVVLNANQTVTYTPNLNFNGIDSFTYTLSDGKGGIDTAMVTITVNAVNDPPVASYDTATTNKDTPVTINVLANDSDPDTTDTLTVTEVTAPSNGTASINSGLSVTYTPNAGFAGTDSFFYTVSDGNGGTAAPTVTVTVTDPDQTVYTVSVSEIQYTTEGGKNNNLHLLITPKLIDGSDNAVANASITVDVLHNGTKKYSFTGTTGTAGTVTFKITNAPSGTYTTSVTNVSDAAWDGKTPINSFNK